MKNEILIRFVYGINQSVFNVCDDGVKKHYDPVSNKLYTYASSSNIKHNISETMYDIVNSDKKCYGPITRIFSKMIEDGKEQGGVSVDIINDIENLMLPLLGAWNSAKPDDNKKYSKETLKSNLKVGDMIPLHPYLTSSKETTGVCVGNSNSKIVYTTKKDIYNSPDELIKKQNIDEETAKKMFSNARPLNFYKENETTNGLYKLDLTIDMNAFGKYDLSGINTISDEVKQKLFESGWEEKIINRISYLCPPKELLIELFEKFVEALFTWDFTSNNSQHGTPKKLLRVSFGHNKTNLVQQTTIAKLIDSDKAKMCIYENIDGVYSFNTELLNEYNYISLNTLGEPINIKTDFFANEKAKDKLLELGKNLINTI